MVSITSGAIRWQLLPQDRINTYHYGCGNFRPTRMWSLAVSGSGLKKSSIDALLLFFSKAETI